MEDVGVKSCPGSTLSVAIIGGGLVGSLAASFFANKGCDVHLYEYRTDIRRSPHIRGRSINLAMSARARKALGILNLETTMLQHGLPMEGRMVHSLDSSTRILPYDAKTKQVNCIYSVDRKYLNEVLLTEAEKHPNVKLNFCHKLIDINFDSGHLTLIQSQDNVKIEKDADLIIGADGAFSTVRYRMMKQPRFNFSQTYIKHGYLELTIPATPDGYSSMPNKYLHIWPRGEFMMIALPNQDRTWTVTLFMPFSKFEELDSPDDLVVFFNNQFPDAVKLIGQHNLITTYFTTKPSPLISIKCCPYHIGDKAIIIGDAAHAMVPFYGQGMNAGFEDCSLLDQLMTKHGLNMKIVLDEFSRIRAKDAYAICDLAMYNYVEMRDLVNKPLFILRKTLDDFLHKILPFAWMPLYNTVTFSDMGYEQCVLNRKWQNKVILWTFFAGCIIGLGIVMYFFNLFIV